MTISVLMHKDINMKYILYVVITLGAFLAFSSLYAAGFSLDNYKNAHTFLFDSLVVSSFIVFVLTGGFE